LTLNLVKSGLECEARAQIFKRLRANTAGSISYSPALSSVLDSGIFQLRRCTQTADSRVITDRAVVVSTRFGSIRTDQTRVAPSNGAYKFR
jgi:hypothetical protein